VFWSCLFAVTGLIIECVRCRFNPSHFVFIIIFSCSSSSMLGWRIRLHGCRSFEYRKRTLLSLNINAEAETTHENIQSFQLDWHERIQFARGIDRHGSECLGDVER